MASPPNAAAKNVLPKPLKSMLRCCTVATLADPSRREASVRGDRANRHASSRAKALRLHPPTCRVGLVGECGAVPKIELAWRAVMEQQELDSDGLPPLAPPEATDDERGRAIEARMVARYGAPSIEDYRRAYAAFGAEWPGDEEIRRRHVVAPSTAA